MLKKFFVLLLLSLSFSQLRCASKPPNVPVCAEINPGKGACVYTMTGQEFIVDDDHKFEGKTWWDMRISLLQMPASSYAKLKAWIIKTCKTVNCDTAVSSWERTLETVDKNVKTRLP